MSNSYKKEEIERNICRFIYYAETKDLYYLEGDEEYLKNKNYNEGTIYVCGDSVAERNYNANSLEYKKDVEEFLKNCKDKENEDKNWINIIDKTCKAKLNENFISLIIKRSNTPIDLIKRPSSFNEFDIKTLINIAYDRDLRKEKLNIEMLGELMYNDNNIIIQRVYDEMKKTIKYLDKKQNPKITFAVIIGLIIAAEKSLKFPQTLTEAYDIFYNEVFKIFSEVSGHIILQSPYFYPIIYFNKMPKEFFKAFPIINSKKEEYDLRIKIQNILKDCIEDEKWILENDFNERTLQIICCFILTDCFSRYPMKINKQEKFEFAFYLFLLIIKFIPKKTIEISELFWQNDLIALFMVCCINNIENKTMSANKIKKQMEDNTPLELDKKSIKNEVIERLKTTKDLDFIIFIFIIAKQIEDEELLDLIKDKDEIKSFAFDKSLKIGKLISKLDDCKLKELLQAIENYCIYRKNEDADDLIFILQETHNELGISYNKILTSAIRDMINSNIKYEDIYNEVKSRLNLKCIKETEKKTIYELIITAEGVLKANNIKNYSPSVNQYCSALEILLNEIIYKPYFYEIQDICRVKNNNYNFTRDKEIIEKYFGDTPHAMWFKNKELSTMGLGDLKKLMENILSKNERLDILKKGTQVTNKILKNIDIKTFFENICKSIEIIKPDRDIASHGGLMDYDKAENIRAKVYKNDYNKTLNPSDLILKIDKDLN